MRFITTFLVGLVIVCGLIAVGYLLGLVWLAKHTVLL